MVWLRNWYVVHHTDLMTDGISVSQVITAGCEGKGVAPQKTFKHLSLFFCTFHT